MGPTLSSGVGGATTDSLDAAGDPAGDRPPRGEVPRTLVLAASWSWRILLVIGAVLAVGWVVVRVRVVLIPLFVALLLTALLAPVVERLGRRMPRLAATWVTLLLAFTVLGVLGWLLQAPIRDAIDDLASSWDTTRADAIDWLRDGPLGLTESQIDSLRDGSERARERFVSGLFEQPQTRARQVIDVATGTFLTIVLTFFFLKDGREMWRWLLAHLHPMRRAAVAVGGRAAFASVQGWIRGIAITGLADAILIGGALVVLGVPAALPLAVLTFLAAFFPIVGATVVGALAALIALATQGLQTAIIVVVVTVVVQQIEGDVLLPLVMRRQVSLHPAVVLVALAFGGAIGGIVGAIVSVPLTAAVSAAVGAIRADATRATSALVVPGDGAGPDP